jgi:hypothetical protein
MSASTLAGRLKSSYLIIMIFSTIDDGYVAITERFSRQLEAIV